MKLPRLHPEGKKKKKRGMMRLCKMDIKGRRKKGAFPLLSRFLCRLP